MLNDTCILDVVLMFLMCFFGAQGQALYKAISRSRSRKPQQCWRRTSPRTVVKTMDGPWWPLEAVAEAHLLRIMARPSGAPWRTKFGSLNTTISTLDQIHQHEQKTPLKNPEGQSAVGAKPRKAIKQTECSLSSRGCLYLTLESDLYRLFFVILSDQI